MCQHSQHCQISTRQKYFPSFTQRREITKCHKHCVREMSFCTYCVKILSAISVHCVQKHVGVNLTIFIHMKTFQLFFKCTTLTCDMNLCYGQSINSLSGQTVPLKHYRNCRAQICVCCFMCISFYILCSSSNIEYLHLGADAEGALSIFFLCQHRSKERSLISSSGPFKKVKKIKQKLKKCHTKINVMRAF